MNNVKLYFTYMHKDGTLRSVNRFRKMRPHHAKLIKEEAQAIGIDAKHYLSIKRRNPPYNALAGAFLNDYAIGFPRRRFEKARPELQRYWIRHELRHCNPIDGCLTIKMMGKTFRRHDVELTEINVKRPATIGFFYEDFDEIKCCDVLMDYYQYCPIERYLE